VTKAKLLSMPVTDAESAEAFIVACVQFFGLSFHPDTPGEHYVWAGEARVFTPAEAKAFDALIDSASEHCDPFEAGLEEMQKRFKEEP
jgi:hypothetical protein